MRCSSRAEDAGHSWRPISRGLTSLNVRSLAVQGSVLYAGTDSAGVFVLPEGAEVWVPFGGPLPEGAQVFELAIKDTWVYAALYSKGLYRVAAGGGSWQRVEDVKPLRFLVHGESLLAGHNPGGVYRSIDEGRTWKLADGLTGRSPTWVLNRSRVRESTRMGARDKKPIAASPKSRVREPSLPWRIHFFQRHPSHDSRCTVPGRVFLLACPPKVRMTFVAVLDAVAAAPPPAFSGGGKWEAMHGTMAGFYEVRVDGPNRHHYRLFCLLERNGDAVGLGGPSIIVIAGMDKPFRTVLSEADYASVRALGDEYRSRRPRSVST